MPTVEVLNNLDLEDLAEDLIRQLRHKDIKDFILNLDFKAEDLYFSKDLIISLIESIDLNGDEIRKIKDIMGWDDKMGRINDHAIA